MVSRPPILQGRVLAGAGWAAGGDGVAVPQKAVQAQIKATSSPSLPTAAPTAGSSPAISLQH